MRYYDSRNHRLIYVNQASTPEFWDELWKPNVLSREQILSKKETFVSRITGKYIQSNDGVILEGGCGRGIHVAALAAQGYHCIGIDNAYETVSLLNRLIPELDIRLGDVRDLDFPDNTMSAVWSLGLIEHFWDGYEALGREAIRVLKPGGLLFLTCPTLSPLRKLKAALKAYPEWDSLDAPADFYQFALDRRSVIDQFTGWGVSLITVQQLDGIKGLKSEIALLSKPLQWLYDYRGRSPVLRIFRGGLSQVLAPVAGHIQLFIFQKLKTNSANQSIETAFRDESH